ncbi:uncharacterized protein LOC124891188 [Capsicum annuum]|uniref:uncharacterized protein LOC124891188 n=1 Tax=Capsicum annuum TaxID=4072 RepID=UPI001FB0DA7E|nr:uncharacterized protein LOC124891188 [Capsicum annuum]
MLNQILVNLMEKQNKGMKSGKVTKSMGTEDEKGFRNSMDLENIGGKEEDDQTKAKRKRSNNDEPKPSRIVFEKSLVNECQIVSMLSSNSPPRFPKDFLSKGVNSKFNKLFDKFSTLSINIPLVEALQDIPGAIMSSTLAKKKNDPGASPYTIEFFKFVKALGDLGVSVNLMPYAIFHKIGLAKPQPTTMKLLIADHSIKKPIRVLYDLLVKDDWFIFPVDFVILDCVMDIKVPIILRRPFLASVKALVDVESDEMKF